MSFFSWLRKAFPRSARNQSSLKPLRHRYLPIPEALETRDCPSTVTSDKPDYAPYSTAIFDAKDFAVGETVQFQVQHIDSIYTNQYPLWVVADGSSTPAFVDASGVQHLPDLDGVVDGNVQTDWQVPYIPGSTLLVTATGLSSNQVATTTFTDNVTVTAATGGTGLSADKAADASGGGSFTTLGDIVIAEPTSGKRDIAASQTNATLILSAPTGWNFQAGAGTVAFVAGNDISAATVSVASSAITVTFTTGSGNNQDTLTISGIKVQAAHGLLASSPNGNIVRIANAVPTSDAVITGITINSTSFGSLSEVAGTLAKVGFSSTAQTLTAGTVSSPVTAQLQDQFGNAQTAGSPQTAALSSSSAGGLFRNTGNTADITTVTVGVGASTATFLYRDFRAGSSTITAAVAGLTAGKQVETVNNVTPTITAATLSAATVAEGSAASLALTFTDPAGTFDTYSARINWGDTATSVFNNVTSGQVFTHPYADGPNTYAVTAVINDDVGGTSAPSTVDATITNVAPTIATFTAVPSVNEGSAATATLSFFDPAGTNDTYAATINWGDATSVYPGVTSGQTYTHTYLDGPFTYAVKATVTDSDGAASSTATTPMNVVNVTPAITTVAIPATVSEGSAASLTVSFDDPAGANDTYTASIDWGDLSSTVVSGVSSGQVYSHTYADGPNNYTVTVNVQDSDFATSAPAVAPVSVANVAPSITSVSGLTVALEGTPFNTSVQFSDPAGTNDTYTATVTWGDGAVSVVAGVSTGQTYSHSYADGPNSYLQTIVITDSDGDSSSAVSRNIDVVNVAPAITSISAPTSIDEGSEASVTIFFSDPAGFNDTYTAIVDWGDLQSTTLSGVSSGVVLSHTYLDGLSIQTLGVRIGDGDPTNSLSSQVLATLTVANVPPTLTAISLAAPTIPEGSDASLTLSFSDPANGNDTYTAVINWGDSSPTTVTAVSSGQIFTHTYADGPHDYTISATVHDEDGGTSSVGTQEISVTNVAPTINSLSIPNNIIAEGSAASVALSFTDPAGINDTYTATVDWGDGPASTYLNYHSGDFVSHTYADGPNVYKPVFQVSDEDGGNSSLVTFNAGMTITNVAPSIASLGISVTPEGSAASLTLNFSDPAGSNDTYTATVSWGDTGSTVVGGVTSGQVFTHIYFNNGPATYTASAVVNDEDGGASALVTADVSIANVAPSISALAAPATVGEGSVASVTLNFSDPSGANDTYTAAINWGDTGSTVVTGVISGQVFTHTYADGPHTYLVSATVNDEDGGTSAMSTAAISVSNVAPSITSISASSATIAEGSTLDLVVGFSDPAGSNDTYTAVIDWGDSAPSTYVGVSSGQTFTHVYVDGPNTYAVNVNISDEDGGNSGGGTWADSVAGSSPQHGFGAGSVIDGFWYVAGRASGGSPNLDVYDAVTDSWASKAPDLISRSNAGAGAIDGKMYVVGGWIGSDSNLATNRLTVYDPIANSWTEKTPAGVIRGATAVAAVGTKLYVTGGRAAGPKFATLEIYDSVADSWTTGAPMPTARESAMAAIVNGKMYVIGGYSVSGVTGVVQAYNPTADSWTTSLAPMPTPVAGAGVATLNGKIYITGGVNASNQIVADVQVYDPATDTWTTAASLPAPRWGSVDAAIGGKLYAGSGYFNTGGGTANTVEIFTPDAVTVVVANVSPSLAAPVLSAATIAEGSDASLTLSFTDPAGTNDTYTATVNWGDSLPSVYAGVSSGDVLTHAYADGPSSYTVSATVNDEDGGASAVATADLAVTNVEPTIRSLVANVAGEGSDTSLTLNFTDPAGTNDTYTATIDWGDSVPSVYTSIASGQVFTHTYFNDDATYVVSATVNDEDGGTSALVTADVTVTNVAPTITSLTATNATIAEGSDATLTIAFTDPANGNDTYTAIINWGDSAPQTVTAVSSGQTFTHTYADGLNNYPVSVTVHDEDAGTSSIATIDLAVTNVAPTLTDLIADAATIAEGSAVNLTLSFTDPANANDTYTAVINWGDSSPSIVVGVTSGQTFAHTYADGDNAYTISATINDEDGGTSSVATADLAVTNVAPSIGSFVAAAATVAEGSDASLTLSFTDPALGNDTYTATINWGDSVPSVYTSIASGQVFTHAYADGPSSYTVSATVNDEDGGASAVSTVDLTVTNVAPSNVALTAVAATVAEASDASVTLNFTDPAGTNDTYTAIVNWGDSAASTYVGVSSGDVLTHAYADGPRSYAVSATINDEDGGTSAVATVDLTVTNVAPTITSLTATNATIAEGSDATLTIAFTDPANGNDTYTAIINWGDSAPQTVTAVSSGQTFTHTYADGLNNYPVSVTVHDEDAGTSAVSTVDLTVTNVAPSITALTPASNTITEASTASISLSFTDPANANDTYTAVINWGDSAPQTVTGVSSGQVFTHVYQDGPNAYDVSATVHDEDGGTSGVSTVSVAVTNVAPIGTLVNSGPVDEGPASSAVTVSFSSSSDVSPVDTSAGLHYTFSILFSGLAGSYAAAGTSSSAVVNFSTGDSGTFFVYGRVFDKDGGFSDYQTTVIVNNVPPTATLSNTGAANEGDTATVSFSGATDPSPVDVSAGLRYSFSTSPSGLASSYSGAGTSASQNFTFNDNGAFLVYGRVIDKDGGFTDYTTTVNLANVAPTAVFSSDVTTVAEGSPVNVSFTGASDPSSADTNAGFHYSFATSTAALAATYAAAGTPAGHAFTFPNNGVDVIYGRIIDKDGGFTDYSLTVSVTNVAPSAVIVTPSPLSIGEGSATTLAVSFQDPGTADTHNVTVQWGDGASTVISLAAGTLNVSGLTHIYADNKGGNAPYTIDVGVSDDDLGTGSGSAILGVSNVAPSITSLGVASPIPEGGTATLTVAFTDPGTVDTHTATINWGDGSSAQTLAVSSGQTFTHPYADNVAATIAVTVVDKDGASSASSVALNVTNVAPSITSLTPAAATIAEGGAASLTLLFADPAGTNDTYTATINWGDSAPSVVTGITSGQVFTHTYADGPNDYTVSATVNDEDSGTSAVATVALAVTNVAPSIASLSAAAATIAEGGVASLTLAFTDPADGNDTYTAVINWGDSAPSVVTGVSSGQVFTHTYADGPNSYTISATVNDEDAGTSAVATVGLAVTNVAPSIVSLSAPATIGEGIAASLTLAFTDPANGSDTYTAVINWGDSAPSVVTGVSSGQVFTHTYADGPNSYTISATVNDEDAGTSAVATANLAVTNVAPSISSLSATAATIAEGSNASVTLAFADPALGNDTYTATINWGDSTSVYTNVSSGRVYSHRYADGPNSYTINATVNDEDGGTSGVATANLAVTNVRPALSAITLFTPIVNAGSPATIAVRFTDPGTLDTHTMVIDWGDSTSVDTVTAITSGQQYMHTYATGPASYNFSLYVRDNDGGQSNTFGYHINVNDVRVIDEGGVVSATLGFLDETQLTPPVSVTYTATIAWGDGSSATVLTGVHDGDIVTHTYQNGPLTTTFTATVNDGTVSNSVTARVPVTVHNVAPSITSIAVTSTSISEGSTDTLTINFTDPGVLDTHTATINWGDGTSAVTAAVTSGQTFAHTYSDNFNPATVNIRVSDNDGGANSQSTFVTVVNANPTISGLSLAASTINQGETATLAVNFTDPGTADTHTATINWGDGSSAQTLAVSSGQTFTHAYATPFNPASIAVTVSDDDGGTASASVNETVKNIPPDAFDDSANVTEDVTLSATGNVLTNDQKGVPTETLTVTAVAGATGSVGVAVSGTYGNVTIGSTGAYTYSLSNSSAAVQALAAGATVTDSFTYTITDNEGGSDTATLNVTITGTNDAPVVNASGLPTLGSFDASLTSNNGALVSSIIASATPTDLITDVDTGALEGVAITGVNTEAADFAPISDDFNRASLGGYTVRSGSGFSVNGSVAAPIGTSVVTLDGFTGANVAVQANITLNGPGSYLGLVARYAGSGDSNLYLGTLVNNGGVVSAEIWKNVAGAYTRLTTATVANGSALLRMEIAGSSLRLYVDGVLKGQVSDGSLAAAGKIGLRGVGGTVDNLYVEPAPAPAFVATDDFNRGALGSNYTVQTGSGFNLNGSTAAPVGASLAVYTPVSASDVAVEANVTLNGPGSYIGLVARYTGTGENNLYLGTLVNNGGVVSAEIWKDVGGTYTRLTTATVTIGSSPLLRLEVLGSSLRILVDGTVYGQIFDTSLGGPGLTGLRGSGGTYDNFKVENAPLGSWEYSTNNGSSWAPLGTVSASSARLLASDANTRVRFIPNPGAVNSAVVPSLTFHAWDQSAGTNGGLADVSTNGGSTPYSTTTEFATESLFASDSFTGSFAAGWQAQVAGLSIVSNHVVSSASPGVSTYNGFKAADAAVQADLSVSANGNFAGILARYSGPGDSNAYAGFLTLNGGQAAASIWKNVGGTWTQLTAQNVGSSAGTVRLEVVGSTLKLFFNGQLVGMAQDSSITAAGTVGLRMGSGGPTADNFLATPLTAPSSTGYTDAFTRANNPSLGSNYNEQIDDISLVGNAASANNFSLATVNGIALKDVSAAADISLSGGSLSYAGLAVRHTGPGDTNMYWAGIVQRDTTFTVELWKAVPNFTSPLATASLTGGTGRLRIDAQGSSLNIYVDGVLKISVTDSSIAGLGDVALRAFKATFDNLSIDAL